MTTLAHAAETELTLADARDIADRTAHHLAGHGARLDGGRDHWTLDFGTRRARLAVAGNRLRLRSEGADASLEQEMRLELSGHLAKFGGPLRIDWPGARPITSPPNFRAMTVETVSGITPHMRRIRLSGPDLLRFDTLAALHCKLLLPPAGAPVVWPDLDPRGRFRHGNGIVRKYTIRALDVAAGWMEVDFVLHDRAGPGSAWAARARPGETLGLIGPGGGGIPMTGPLLMAGDETALPAIAALPVHVPAHAIIEIADRAEQQPLPAGPNLRLDWLYRGNAAPGTLLAQALADAAPGADTHVWAACEFGGFRAIRTHLRGRLNHPRDRHLVTSYWRLGMGADRIERRLAVRP